MARVEGEKGALAHAHCIGQHSEVIRAMHV